MIIGGIALLIFAIVALSTAKPSAFSCSRATKTCTWVHTNAIGWTSTDEYPLFELSHSGISVHHDPRHRSPPAYVWRVDLIAGYLDLAATEDRRRADELEAYANALQGFINDPARQSYGLTIDPDAGDANGYALLLVIGLGISIGGFVWRRRLTRSLEA